MYKLRIYFSNCFSCVADVSSVCSDEGLTLQTSATHQTSPAKKHTILKPIFSLLTKAEKNIFWQNIGVVIFTDKSIQRPSDWIMFSAQQKNDSGNNALQF